jgi:hypothetical protein
LREDLANEGVVSQTAHANSYAPSTFMDPKYPVPPRFKDIACLASPYKQFGNKKNHYATFNYNYYPTIGVTGQMTKDAAILYKRYPKYYWKETPVQWVEFFSGKGSWDDPVIPGLKANVMQTPLSARGILYMLGLAGAIFYFIRIRTRTLLTETKFLVFVLLNVGYALFAGIFVAIFDGPRYRLPFEFYFLFLAVWVLNRFSLRHKVIE